MKHICILYPIGNCINPITGGELYDSYLFKKIVSSNKMSVSFITKTDCKGINKWLLPIYIIYRKKITSFDLIFLNSAWFAQSIWILFYIKIFYPKLPIYIIHHHFRYQEKSGIKKYIYYTLERKCLSLSASIITPNPYTKSEIERIIPQKHIVFLEMSFNKNNCIRSSYYDKQLLFVGSVYKRKGLSYLLHALGCMSEKERAGIHLDIVGNLPSNKYLAKLSKLISNYKLEKIITFVGHVSAEQLKEYYSKAYCFVFPSLLEGYGMVLIEAMSYGLPVISFNNSAMPFTVITGKNGILVKNRDIIGLKKAILKICDEKEFHQRLCRGALDTYNNVRSLANLNVDIENVALRSGIYKILKTLLIQSY